MTALVWVLLLLLRAATTIAACWLIDRPESGAKPVPVTAMTLQMDRYGRWHWTRPSCRAEALSPLLGGI